MIIQGGTEQVDNFFLKFSGSGIKSKIARGLRLLVTIMLLGSTVVCYGQKKDQTTKAKPLPPLQWQNVGSFIYHPDSLGNRIVDFSYCGYLASRAAIPKAIPVKVRVPLKKGDATRRIQAAIDYVSQLPVASKGFRGTVQLEPGVYHIQGSLHIQASGVVLKGCGPGEGGTTLLGEGTLRAPVLVVAGKKDSVNSEAVAITDDYVPVNAQQISVEHPQDFKVGQQVVIRRPSTESWFKALKTVSFGGGLSWLGWKPGAQDIYWSRKITKVTASGLSLDAPLTTALDKKYGGGTVAAFKWPGRISHVGIENLHLVSSYDHSRQKDEDHRWMAIVVNNATDGWVRRVNFEHFAGSVVSLLEGAARFTVQDCVATDPVSEIGGQRRYVFSTTGQQNLFQRLYSEKGYHDFSVGFCAAGPNAFVQCQGEQSLSYSGSVNSWASGVLFDLVRLDGQTIKLANLGHKEQGAGWNAANSLLWNCYASMVDCYQPPTAQNYAYGIWAEFDGDGHWEEPNSWINPRSFYYAQLAQRLGHDVSDIARIKPFVGEGSSSPTVEAAAAMSKDAYHADKTMRDWIGQIIKQHPLPVATSKAPTIDAIGVPSAPEKKKITGMQLRNGWLVRAGAVITGGRQQTPWWFGSVQKDYLAKSKPAITRFVPGRTGTGLIDNLDSVTSQMEHKHITVMEQNYGLWYDRRRDDHERVRRQNGNVWPPFYELPFARSGEGKAWDGLSKYDLTKYNKWYWQRLKRFADLADEKGLVLIHHNYFQHNIIEAGAHYADFPWRPVNNINHTGFPEPINYAADKRLFMADQFYDETNPARRKLHQAFIDQCLANFKDNHNVIQFICEEFTGPTHFVRFWLQTIADWEKTHGHTSGTEGPFIGLSTTKDVQDSILADPAYSQVVDIIDIRYWYYQKSGDLYAPKGGKSLAPRQWARLLKPKNTNFEQVYRAVRHYRDQYPDKAVMYSAKNAPELAWASFMAGGSLAALPPALPTPFLKGAGAMRPVDLPGDERKNTGWGKEETTTGICTLASQKGDYILYVKKGHSTDITLKGHKKAYLVKVIDPASGQVLATKNIKTSANGQLTLEHDGQSKDQVYWLQRK